MKIYAFSINGRRTKEGKVKLNPGKINFIDVCPLPSAQIAFQLSQLRHFALFAFDEETYYCLAILDVRQIFVIKVGISRDIFLHQRILLRVEKSNQIPWKCLANSAFTSTLMLKFHRFYNKINVLFKEHCLSHSKNL